MSTSYGWEGIRQVCATLLGACHVPERLCGGAYLQRGAITSVRPLTNNYSCMNCKDRVTTHLEKSGNSKVAREDGKS